MAESDEFKARNYQVELMKIAISKNTIIYLPTGAGKTYIAVLVLKQMSAPLTISWDNGGKVTILLANTVALVHQHGKYIKRHTPFSVGVYTGELNVDFWNEVVWNEQCRKHKVLVMTCQILTDAVEKKLIDLNKVNLLIFDECHSAVNDQPMRQLMKNFQHVGNQPRVLGLTATLLNGNCKQPRVRELVQNLEITYHSKVATVDELKDVLGYSTNPQEKIVFYHENVCSNIEEEAIEFLGNTANAFRNIFLDTRQPPSSGNLTYLDPDKGQTELANLLTDTIIHIQMLGIYGGLQAILAHTIQIECMKKFCEDEKFYNVLCAAVTSLTYVKILLSRCLSKNEEYDICNYSSPKVKMLLNILKEYKNQSKEELCAIIFVKRRFTAKVLFHLLKTLSQHSDYYSFLKPNFIVGYNANPFSDSRESLFLNKVNREVILGFFSKESNILVSSNVLEEGVDVPTCSLVVKFDEPLDYRSYIQSKGRARHRSSLYYIMVEQKAREKYISKYISFQSVEEELNNYLIGQNETRVGPNRAEIEELYNEDDLPPYYVDGPGSPHVTMVAAVSLLSTYCSSFESDAYTSYAPNWYLEKLDNKKLMRVVIELPIVCPHIDAIYGEFMTNRKQAKRAAALKACEILHKIGELDSNLRPIKRTELDETTEFLFNHWPKQKEKSAGNKKNNRLHKIHVPKCCMGPLSPTQPIYLHIINLQPYLNMADISASALADLYLSDLCFGIVSPKKFPMLCQFPLYVSSGELEITIETNASTISLSDLELEDIRRFNYLIFNDILGILKRFLAFNDENTVLIVPVSKERKEICFDVIRENRQLKEKFREPTREERLYLNITESEFLNKIVTPWYRKDDAEYLVTKICYDMNASTSFPGNHKDYKSYYKSLYQCTILNSNAPLIKVNALSLRTNCIKPRGKKDRKNKEAFLSYIIHLVPELVVVQDFPSCLWLQARLLPSLFDKVFQMLRVEEIRTSIARATGIGVTTSTSWRPLKLDEHLIKYEFESYKEDDEIETDEIVEVVNMDKILSLTYKLNKEVVSNTLQEEYPWERSEEPIDIERNLDVTLVDIYDYLKFIKNPVSTVDRQIRNSPEKQKPAITYNVDFVPVDIKILNIALNRKGPELADIYKAFATAKANDIVNLERSETLGDSFLKFIVSLFIILKYPKYDEGKSTSLKGRMVSNKNLYYVAEHKKLGSYLKFSDLSAKEDWCPPGFCLPSILRTKSIQTNVLLSTTIPMEEQITGFLSEDTIATISKDMAENTAEEETLNNAINYYIGERIISDKFVADAVESVLGVYLESCGIPGAIKTLEWFNIIPTDAVNLSELFEQPLANPVLNHQATPANINFHIPSYEQLEKCLGYTFNNRAYLLQALTHSSYTPNRITQSYQRLEFLGDAVLDFLITMFIYENCGNLTPGDLTDLRSALVNNITFACFTVRCGFHKYILLVNDRLQSYVDKFVRYQENKNFSINDDVLILLNEDDYHIAEYVDVPKVLGDIFESLAGAVFLDSGMNLKVVWEVIYRIMWKEINEFRNNVPKNAVRVLRETTGAHPEFHKPIEIGDGRIMVKLDLMINGTKKRVHGFGDNKTVAKRAAAKIALRLLGR